MKLHDSPVSGNCYKVRLLLAHLGRPYERIDVSAAEVGERRARLRSLNPTGRVPILELDDGRHLAESNAILWYLAEGTPYLLPEPFERARVLQWLFFEQNHHEPNIAVARYLTTVARVAERHPEWMKRLHRGGEEALAAMERHLGNREWLAGDYSIADIALYAYTHVAGEGGFDLEPFPAVRDWLARVASRPGHVPIDA